MSSLNKFDNDSLKNRFCVIVIPRISDYYYLRFLYREIILSSENNKAKLSLFSLSPSSNSGRDRFLYPFKIITLLLRRKNCNGKKVILHIHWIELLYRWGNNKYLLPFLVLPINLFFRAYKKITKNKIVVTLHNIVPHQVYWPRIEYWFFKTMLQRISDNIFVHSSLQKKTAANFYNIESKKIRVIQHGFFRKPKLPTRQQCEKNRSKLRIPKADIVFSSIGRISEYKGVSILLEAAGKFFKDPSSTRVRLIIAGKGSRTYIRRLSKSYQNVLSNKRLMFLNKRLSDAELDEILSVADFGICPYVRATTPATILDFMCYALPVITTDDPNIPVFVGDYPLIIAKRGDSNSLANVINLVCKKMIKGETRTNLLKKTIKLSDAWRISADSTLKCYYGLVRT